MVENLTHDQLREQLNEDLPPHIIHHIEQRLNRLSASKSPDSNPMSPSGASDGSSSGSRFDFNLEFLKLGQQRNKDGEKPKRRGPKPDSKPALTRRQELNRQAQRTHRERKERYVKGLEEEVIRLRETFTIITREKTQILEENRRLKDLLRAHGILYSENDVLHTNNSIDRERRQQDAPEISRFNRSYDEIGVDFVLALEQPCLEHMKFLTSNATNDSNSDFHGHALMLSCPPESHNLQNPDVDWGLKTFDLPATDLSVLFHLSNRLQLEGEITPIQIWAIITHHPQFSDLDLKDIETLRLELQPQVKCHGFGAVCDEQTVHDILDHHFAARLGVTFVGAN